MMRFLVWGCVVIIGVPLALVLLNALVGWQPAVLAMPVALAVGLFWKRLRKRVKTTENNEKARSKNPSYAGRFLDASLAGIPLFSVVSESPDAMRLWAPAVAIAFGIGMLKDYPNREEPIPSLHLGTMLIPCFVLLYAGLSELIWAFLPFWAWLIFHGSILLGLAFCILAVVETYNWLFQVEATETEYTKSKPPRAANGDRTERLQAHTWASRLEATDYGHVRRSHASRLVDDLAVAQPSKLGTISRFDLGYPRLQIDFEFSHELTITRSEDHTFKLQAFFLSNPRRVLSTKNVLVDHITREAVDNIVRLAWRDNWRAIEGRLDAMGAQTN